MPGAAILWRIFSWLITAVNALLRRSIEAVGVPPPAPRPKSPMRT
jgi:hypothetical protein